MSGLALWIIGGVVASVAVLTAALLRAAGRDRPRAEPAPDPFAPVRARPAVTVETRYLIAPAGHRSRLPAEYEWYSRN